MDKNLFLKTVKEVLKYDKKYCKDEYRNALIKLISRSKVNFVPQYEFANHGRSYQHWENIELRIPVPLLNEARIQEKISMTYLNTYMRKMNTMLWVI